MSLTTYKRNGFTFSLVERSGDFAVFHGLGRIGGETIELIKVQNQRERVIGGKKIEAGEVPPSNSEWGSCGWTYPPHRMDRALAQMHALSNEASVSKASEAVLGHSMPKREANVSGRPIWNGA